MSAAAPQSAPDASFSTDRAVLRALAAGKVILSDPGEIGSYLERYPDLAALVPEICTRAEQEFGVQAQLTLQVYHDPEIDDHLLTLYVRQSSYNNDIMTRIDRIWLPFAEKLSAMSGYLLITTDFRKAG